MPCRGRKCAHGICPPLFLFPSFLAEVAEGSGRLLFPLLRPHRWDSRHNAAVNPRCCRRFSFSFTFSFSLSSPLFLLPGWTWERSRTATRFFRSQFSLLPPPSPPLREVEEEISRALAVSFPFFPLPPFPLSSLSPQGIVVCGKEGKKVSSLWNDDKRYWLGVFSLVLLFFPPFSPPPSEG